MNHYTQITAEGAIKGVSKKDFDTLVSMLDGTGIEAELWEPVNDKAGEVVKGNLYLYSEEFFDEETFIESGAIEFIGALLKKRKVEYLELGMSFSGSKAAAGSAGGTAVRIYDNGDLVWSERVWPSDKPKKQKVWVLTDADFQTCEVFANRKDGETFGKENFDGTTVNRVKSTETVFQNDADEVVAILIQKTVQGGK